MPKAKTPKKKVTKYEVCPKCTWKRVRSLKKDEFDKIKQVGVLYRQVLNVEQYAQLNPLVCGNCHWVNFYGNLEAYAASGFYRDVDRVLS